MALVVVTDPLSTQANSYVSLSQMLDYVSTRVPDPAVAIAWAALSPALQATYVVNASRAIDQYASWIGKKYSRDQGLSWPRFDAWVDGYHVDNITFPLRVVEATCEMVIWSMQNSGAVSVSQNAEFSSIKVGPIDIDFNEDVSGAKDKYFPDIVAVLLRDYASLDDPALPGGKSIKVVRLNRA